MKTLKTIVLLACSLILAAGAIGCGGVDENGNGDGNGEPADTDAFMTSCIAYMETCEVDEESDTDAEEICSGTLETDQSVPQDPDACISARTEWYDCMEANGCEGEEAVTNCQSENEALGPACQS